MPPNRVFVDMQPIVSNDFYSSTESLKKEPINTQDFVNRVLEKYDRKPSRNDKYDWLTFVNELHYFLKLAGYELQEIKDSGKLKLDWSGTLGQIKFNFINNCGKYWDSHRCDVNLEYEEWVKGSDKIILKPGHWIMKHYSRYDIRLELKRPKIEIEVIKGDSGKLKDRAALEFIKEGISPILNTQITDEEIQKEGCVNWYNTDISFYRNIRLPFS